MSSRLALFLLLVMITYTEVRVYAQAQQSDKAPSWPPVLSPERPEGIPDNVPWPPPIDKLPPPPNPLPNVPSDVKPPPAAAPLDLLNEEPLIAGVPYREAWAIIGRHRDELMKIPGVTDIFTGEKGIVVTVRDLEAQKALPPALEGLPIVVEFRLTLPPPPGVIVLRPGGVREQADACPEGFMETKRLDWRFCLSPGDPGPIPPLMAPPIAGIPYEEALQILERHQKELMLLPGVEGFGLGDEGIDVWTTKPEAVPSEIEGLPVKTQPPHGIGIGVGHTESTQVRPLHGGVTIDGGLERGTLTSVAHQNKEL